MAKIQYPVGSRWVFAQFPESEEAAQELATFVRLYQSIERSGVKTGLYIVAEVPFEGRTLVVSSLERKEAITAEILTKIKNQILDKLQERK